MSMLRVARFLPFIALAACGDVIAVQLFEPIACLPMVPGDSLQLMAQTVRESWPTVDLTSATKPKEFEWSSSAPQILRVNRHGVLVAESLGTATISVRAKGFQDVLTIVVGSAKNTVSVSPNTFIMRVGESASVMAQAWDSVGAPIDLQNPGRTFFWNPTYPTAVEVNERQGGATLVARQRGATAVNWTVVGRCGMISATVR